MKFLHVKTNNLVGLAGRNKQDKIDWEKMGTSVMLINFNETAGTIEDTEGKIHAILPIGDEIRATEFVEGVCAQYNVPANIITEEEAKTLKADIEAAVAAVQ